MSCFVGWLALTHTTRWQKQRGVGSEAPPPLAGAMDVAAAVTVTNQSSLALSRHPLMEFIEFRVTAEWGPAETGSSARVVGLGRDASISL